MQVPPFVRDGPVQATWIARMPRIAFVLLCSAASVVGFFCGIVLAVIVIVIASGSYEPPLPGYAYLLIIGGTIAPIPLLIRARRRARYSAVKDRTPPISDTARPVPIVVGRVETNNIARKMRSWWPALLATGVILSGAYFVASDNEFNQNDDGKLPDCDSYQAKRAVTAWIEEHKPAWAHAMGIRVKEFRDVQQCAWKGNDEHQVVRRACRGTVMLSAAPIEDITWTMWREGNQLLVYLEGTFYGACAQVLLPGWIAGSGK